MINVNDKNLKVHLKLLPILLNYLVIILLTPAACANTFHHNMLTHRAERGGPTPGTWKSADCGAATGPRPGGSLMAL